MLLSSPAEISCSVPSSISISSPCKPFPSRNVIFCSRGASRTVASCRNILACSRTVLRSFSETRSGTSFWLAFEVSFGAICHAGMEGFGIGPVCHPTRTLALLIIRRISSLLRRSDGLSLGLCSPPVLLFIFIGLNLECLTKHQTSTG